MSRNERIMQMASEGLSYGLIAKRLGVSRGAVSGVVHRNRDSAPNPDNAGFRKGIRWPVFDGSRTFSCAEDAAKFHKISTSYAWKKASEQRDGWRYLK